jgi:hypothetical protein
MLIKPGDTGPAVELVQSRLRELGYFRGVESGFGPDTMAAVRRFQRDQGLSPDGVVGPRTRARLLPLVRFTRDYLDRVLYGGRQVYDALDDVVAAVATGEWGAFDALQLNGDGAGLSFGILQWAQGPGSLQTLLQALNAADGAKFVKIFGAGDPGEAQILLAKTRGPGKKLALWLDPWPRRFWLAGRDLEFQRVQRSLARRQLAALLQEGMSLYPERFQPEGRIALRALVMMADVGNQAGPLGLQRALRAAAARGLMDEASFIRALGEYVENLIRRKYGDPNFGNTRGRHAAICSRYGLEPVNWPALAARLAAEAAAGRLPA